MSSLIPDGYKLDETQQAVFTLLDQSFDNLMLSGRAGTGKSTFIEYFKQRTKKKFIILAPTGVAAVNVGGQTIHSFFGFPTRKMRPNDPEITVWPDQKPATKVLQQLDMLIIDEVSMVRADILDAIDESLRLQLGNNLEPFGGLQIVLVGDAYQLAPVDRQDEEQDKPFLNLPPAHEYKTPYFFSARAFKGGRFKMFEFAKVYRQNEGVFLDLLNQVRTGDVTLQTLDALNHRVDQSAFDAVTGTNAPILLTTTNAIADAENLRQLNALTTKPVTFEASIERNFKATMCRAEASLVLKPGARVMMLVNDSLKRWSNGSLGTFIQTVVDEDSDNVLLEIDLDNGGKQLVSRHQWENAYYKIDNKTNEITKEVSGTFTQYPLRLAWAITIHKSQGLTFDKMRVDLGYGTFAAGQLYVALSRCRSLEGIVLKRPISGQSVIVSREVQAFADYIAGKMEKQDLNPTAFIQRRPVKPGSGQQDEAFKKQIELVKKERQATRKAEQQERNRAAGKAANEGSRYTADDLALLRKLFAEKASLQTIGSALDRKPSGIGSKLKGLGLIELFNVSAGYVIMADPAYAGPEPPSFEPEDKPDWDEALEKQFKQIAATADDLSLIEKFKLSPQMLLVHKAKHGMVPPEGASVFGYKLEWRK